MGDPLTPINAAASSGAQDPSWEKAEILAELVVTDCAGRESSAAAVVPGGTVTAVPSPRAGSP
ncbi:hypothetical protein [Streptomyces sp. NBC_01594]|uniref:hypothetical protein n=1 Tax=Streptomyces sp. NBC_01594 TaxID=2975890 RepID=UPI003866F464